MSVILAVLGVVSGTLLVGWYGFHHVTAAILSVGMGGFIMMCAWQAVMFVQLGWCWRIVVPQADAPRSGGFIWGRMIRDSAGTCLPFSQVGGFLLGARAAALHGLTWPVATVSLVVDLTAEFLSMLLFAVLGVLVLIADTADGSKILPIALGVGGVAAFGGVVARYHAHIAPLCVRFGQRVLGDWIKGGLSPDTVSQMDLATLYSRTRRMVAATAAHLLGWVGKGVGNWLAYHLMGAPVSLAQALAIEGLLHAALIPAFIIPGYAGVQEAGYAAIGALFGIPAELSVSVSLLRRARDIALGVPILLFWQGIEVRRLNKRV